MIFDTLRTTLQQQATNNNGKVLLLKAVSDASATLPAGVNDLLLNSLMIKDDLSLTVQGQIPAAANNSLAFSGTANTLNVSTNISILFTLIQDNVIDIQLRISFPATWTFSSTYNSIAGYPTNELIITLPEFIFTSKTADSCSWYDSQKKLHSIELSKGLNFVGELGFSGILQVITPILSSSSSSTQPIVLSGTIDNTELVAGTAFLPAVNLSALLNRPLQSIGSALFTFSLTNPRVGLQTMQASDPAAGMALWLVFSIDLSIDSVSITITAPLFKNFASLYFIATPTDPKQFNIDEIVKLLAGNDFNDSVPPEISSLFNFFGLQSFSVSIDLTQTPTISALEVAIGSSLKNSAWSLGPVTIERLTLVYAVLDPFVDKNPFISFSSEFQFLPEAFPGNFDLEITKGDNDLAIAAGYQGSVDFATFVDQISGNTIQAPFWLPRFSFTDFGIGFIKTDSGYDWNFYAVDERLAIPLKLAGSEVTSSFQIIIQSTSGQKTYTLSGGLEVGNQFFNATVDLGSNTNKLLASWHTIGSALSFEDIATAFGFPPSDIPDIPSDLDLSLKSARLTYDFPSKTQCETLIIGAESANYGNAVFVALKNATGGHDFFFLLGIDKTFDLSNLPLVGAELAQIEKISVESLCIVISSAASISGPTARAINNQINQIKPQGSKYPTLPTNGVSGNFMLTAVVDFGNEQSPLQIGMGSSGTSGSASGDSGSGGACAQPGGVSAEAPTAAPTTGSSQVATTTATDGTTWFNVQKSFGPVSIQKIGARYVSSQQSLWFEIDAAMTTGPLTVSLDGLGFGSPIHTFKSQFSLQGMGISWSKPPLTVAGTFVNMNPAKGFEFEGGVTIGGETFQLQAFGFYGNQNKKSSPSLFIFGDIAHDFGGPPAFFVTGVALGFGYNSSLRLPTVDQVATFPFIQVLPDSNPPNASALPSNNPQAVLSTIMNTTPPWITEQAGSLWFAAGITFTSFDIVNSQALVVVEPGADLTISLLGTSRAQFPQNSDQLYANIVLDLDAVFKPEDGAFSLQAVLDKSSFLINPACVLTGGFAFCVWYGNNPHAGDFVLTLGGYNPGFVAPSYYPTEPKLGFNWALDSSITISGNAYLAFTPSVMMLGGELDAVYHSGNLKAWFDAHADVIISWKPFWFDANIGISIGASYRVDLWFTSFTVSVELGCDLELWGPPTGGQVHVDWYIISFTIPFGASKTGNAGNLSWWDVEAMLPNTGSASSRNILSLTPTAGLMPPGSNPDSMGDWVVRRGSFGFTAASPAPATTVKVGTSYTDSGSSFNVTPLGWSNVSATHTVTITNSSSEDSSGHFTVTPITKNLPASLWGSPTKSTPTGDSQLVMNQLVGVTVEINPPQTGASAGPVKVANLQYDNLGLVDAVLPISSTAQPTGSSSEYSSSCIATITNADSGIASKTTVAARTAIFKALKFKNIDYAPATKNDDMSGFSGQIGTALNAEPLLIT